MRYRVLLMLFFGGLLGLGDVYAQEEYYEYTVYPREEYYKSEQQQRSFSNEQWMKVIEGIDYSESVRAERQEDENFFTSEEERRKRNQRSYEKRNQSGSEAWAAFFKFLIIALGIGIIAIIIARFLGPEGLGKPRSKRIDNDKLEINLKNIDERIHESDLDQLIQQALALDNYNLAIRLYYLAVIKALSLNKKIRWKKDKTNRNYLLELSGQPFLPEFRALTLIYERSWYGLHPLTKDNFQTLQPRFTQMINDIPKQSVQETV